MPHGNLQRAEIIGRREIRIDDRRVGIARQRTFEDEQTPRIRMAERQRARVTHGVDVADPPRALRDRVVVTKPPLGGPVVERVGHEAERQHVVRLEPGIDVQQPHVALAEHSDRQHQHERERHLHDDERVQRGAVRRAIARRSVDAFQDRLACAVSKDYVLKADITLQPGRAIVWRAALQHFRCLVQHFLNAFRA